MLVAFQLALTAAYELSEARWLPSSKQEMALIGPIVRNELFFFVFIFGAATLLILRECGRRRMRQPRRKSPARRRSACSNRRIAARAAG